MGRRTKKNPEVTLGRRQRRRKEQITAQIALYQEDERKGVQNFLLSQQKKVDKYYQEIERIENLCQYEKEYSQYDFICGIDEVGRGPLAGPVVAGAVVLPKGSRILYINDSKKLTKALGGKDNVKKVFHCMTRLRFYVKDKSLINENEINRFFISRLKHRNTIEEEAFEEYLHKNGIKYVTLASELYPQKLKSINNPPYVLFYKGDLSIINNNIRQIDPIIILIIS